MRNAGSLLRLLLLCTSAVLLLLPPAAHAATPTENAQQLMAIGIGHGVKLIRAGGHSIRGTIVAVDASEVELMTARNGETVTVALDEVTSVQKAPRKRALRLGIIWGVSAMAFVAATEILTHH